MFYKGYDSDKSVFDQRCHNYISIKLVIELDFSKDLFWTKELHNCEKILWIVKIR